MGAIIDKLVFRLYGLNSGTWVYGTVEPVEKAKQYEMVIVDSCIL